MQHPSHSNDINNWPKNNLEWADLESGVTEVKPETAGGSTYLGALSSYV